MAKIISDKPVTQGILNKELKEFKMELKEELKVDLNKRFDKQHKTLRDEWRSDIRDMADSILKGVGSMFDKLNDQILSSHDKIMKRLDDLDADNAAGLLQTKRLENRLDGHNRRLKVLEAKN